MRLRVMSTTHRGLKCLDIRMIIFILEWIVKANIRVNSAHKSYEINDGFDFKM